MAIDMIDGHRLSESFFNGGTQRFFSPSRWFWGPEAIDQSLELLAELRCPLLVFDGAVSGLAAFERIGAVSRWSGKHRLSGPCCTETAQALAGELGHVGAIVAVGGGSTIDTVKGALAHWLYGDLDGLGMGSRRAERPLPDRSKPTLICFPTTCGAGAEASRYYVTYRRHDRSKVHGKSWHLVANWIFGDPSFLEFAPDSLLVETAFDAFVHFWESYFCQFERGELSRAISLHGMATVLGALPGALRREASCLNRLCYAGTLGGVAIANVRTGHIHEAAGPLLEASGLSHGAALWVFFPTAVRDLGPIVAADPSLCRILEACGPLASDPTTKLIAWWHRYFADAGIQVRIAAAIDAVNDQALQDRIHQRISTDRVWCAKESPIRLDDEAIRRFVANALATQQ